MYSCSVASTKAFGISEQCRCDAKYLSFVSQDNWNAFHAKGKLCALSTVLSPSPIKKVAKGELDETSFLVNISDQEPTDGILNLNNVESVDEINSDKTFLSGCDIIVSKLGMPKGYIYLLPKLEKNVIGSTEFIPYRINSIQAPYFILYLLLTPEMRHAYSSLETGKTPSHKRVNPYEFLKIRVPQITCNISKVDEALSDIVHEIEELVGQIESVQDRIEEHFSREFNYNSSSAARFGKGVTQPTQLLPPRGCRITTIGSSALSRSSLLRMSTRYNNDTTQVLMAALSKIPTIALESLVLVPVHRGCSPKYVVDGEIPVVKTAHLINGNVLISEEEFVSSCEYEKNERAQVQMGDLLIASTGKGSIGKVALVREEIRLYADSHISIIRIDNRKYNPEFAFYFLQCILGYFQIERDYTGCTNQVEIDKDSIGKLLVPDISIGEQTRIVSEIKAEIAKQDDIRDQISKLRRSINEIIYTAIREVSGIDQH